MAHVQFMDVQDRPTEFLDFVFNKTKCKFLPVRRPFHRHNLVTRIFQFINDLFF